MYIPGPAVLDRSDLAAGRSDLAAGRSGRFDLAAGRSDLAAGCSCRSDLAAGSSKLASESSDPGRSDLADRSNLALLLHGLTGRCQWS